MRQSELFKTVQDAHLKLYNIITRRLQTEEKRRARGQAVYSSTVLQTRQLAEVYNTLDDGLDAYQQLLEERPSLIEKSVLFNSVALLDRRGLLPPATWPNEKLIESIRRSTDSIQARCDHVLASKGGSSGQD